MGNNPNGLNGVVTIKYKLSYFRCVKCGGKVRFKTPNEGSTRKLFICDRCKRECAIPSKYDMLLHVTNEKKVFPLKKQERNK